MENTIKLNDNITMSIIKKNEIIKDAIRNNKFIIGINSDKYSILKSWILEGDLPLFDYIQYVKYFDKLTLCIPFMYSTTTSLINEYNAKSFRKILKLYDYIDDINTMNSEKSVAIRLQQTVKELIGKIPSIKKTANDCLFNKALSSNDFLYYYNRNYNEYTTGVSYKDITIIAPICFVSIDISYNNHMFSFDIKNAIPIYNFRKSDLSIISDSPDTHLDSFFKCSKINLSIQKDIVVDNYKPKRNEFIKYLKKSNNKNINSANKEKHNNVKINKIDPKHINSKTTEVSKKAEMIFKTYNHKIGKNECIVYIDSYNSKNGSDSSKVKITFDLIEPEFIINHLLK